MGGQVIPPLVDVAACKQEFFAFKLQICTEWMDKTFGGFYQLKPFAKIEVS